MVRELFTLRSWRGSRLPCPPNRCPGAGEDFSENPEIWRVAGIWDLIRAGGKTLLPDVILLALKVPAAASAGCEDSAPLGPSACHG